MRAIFALFALVMLSACATAVVPVPEATPVPETEVTRVDPVLPSPARAADNFIAVVDRMEPIAERICRAERPGVQCDFQIVVDSRPEVPANAFQTLDRSGRPVIIFTIALIADARNQNELAFILGHEAAHHIAGHIPKTQASAVRGAILAGTLASLGGANEASVRIAQQQGAAVGARSFSKEFELEADALGAVIAFRAGFDPVVGAQYFERIPDPGNEFLGSHPPNQLRIDRVRATVARLQ